MFKKVRHRWREVRGRTLRKEAEVAIFRLDGLPQDVNVRAADAFAASYKKLMSGRGSFENVSIDGKRKLSKMLSTKARKTFELDMGRAYGFALLACTLSLHVCPVMMPNWRTKKLANS